MSGTNLTLGLANYPTMPHFYTAVLLALLFSSCSTPLQMVRIEPESEATVDRYFYGNAIQQQQRDGITVETNFYDATPEYVIFDVMVINDGAADVLFDPVTAMLYTGEQQGHRALDPEVELFSLDMEVLHRERGRRTMAWVGGALVVAGTAYAIAEGSSPTEVPTTSSRTADLVGDLSLSLYDVALFNIVDTEQRIRTTVQPTELPGPDNRFFWLDHALRRTTIRPGERAVGKLIFARSDEVDRLRLSVPVAERRFDFAYQQRVYRPGPNRSAQEVGRSR